ncbi:hypothetical protein K439DRAFT_1622343 [Ramaria rubella]|nr:hypothetical protein K439DRAFT_1622343 [Ramaria rubella]
MLALLLTDMLSNSFPAGDSRCDLFMIMADLGTACKAVHNLELELLQAALQPLHGTSGQSEGLATASLSGEPSFQLLSESPVGCEPGTGGNLESELGGQDITICSQIQAAGLGFTKD